MAARQCIPSRVRAFTSVVDRRISAESILEAYASSGGRTEEVSYHVARLMELAKSRDKVAMDDPRYLSMLAQVARHRISFTTQMLCGVVEALGRLGRSDLLSDTYTTLILSSLEYLGPDVLTVVAKTYAMHNIQGEGAQKIFAVLDQRIQEERNTFTLVDLCTAMLSSEIYRERNPSSKRRTPDYPAILADLIAAKERLSTPELADALRAFSIVYRRRLEERDGGIRDLADALLASEERPPQLASSVTSLLDLDLPDHAAGLLRRHLTTTDESPGRRHSAREAVSLIRVMTRLHKSREAETRKWWQPTVDALYLDVIAGLADLDTAQSMHLLRAIAQGRVSRVCPSRELKKEVIPLLMTEVLREIRSLPPSTVAFALRCCVKLQYWDSDFLAGASKVFLDRMEEYLGGLSGRVRSSVSFGGVSSHAEYHGLRRWDSLVGIVLGTQGPAMRGLVPASFLTLYNTLVQSSGMKVFEYPSRALASCLWALTKAGLDSKEVAEKAVLCARDRVMEMTPQDATTIAWTMARARFRADALKYLTPMLSRALREERMNARDKAMLLWTIAEHSSDGLLENPPLEDFSTLAEGITRDLGASLISDSFTNADIIVLLLSLSQCGRSPEDAKTAILSLHRALYGRVNSLDLSSLCFAWFLIAVSELSDPALQGPIALATARKMSRRGITASAQDAANAILALQKSSGIDDIEKLIREPLRTACMKAIVDEPQKGRDEGMTPNALRTFSLRAMAGPEALRLGSEEVDRIVSALTDCTPGFSQQQQVRCLMSLAKLLKRHGKSKENELLAAITQVQDALLLTASNSRPKGSDLLAMCWSQLKLTQYLSRTGGTLSPGNRKFLSRLRRTMHHAVEQRRIPWPELCENIQLLHSAGVFDSLSYEAKSELWRSASYRQKKGVPRPERRDASLGAGVDPRSGLKGLHKKFRTPAATKHAYFQISESKLVEEKTEPEEEELFDKDRIYGGMQPSRKIPAQSFIEQVRRLKEQEGRNAR
ncbi:hypothetical protein FOL46_007845 [Perkinsus olseni]|uniref:Uncharacterized protein n=1 Tax=Perkinsus olseni TaxID=32597 RepID=A0A7J6LAX5_PEROL|nr:hypothetical protein FOL46_007845 [Perkinsus olseni]